MPENIRTTSGAVKPDAKKNPQTIQAKKRKSISFAAVFSILLILLIAGAGAAVYFDLGGLKGAVVCALQTESPEPEETPVPTPDPQAAALSKLKKSLLDKEQALYLKEKDLKAKEEELGAKEEQIARREAAVAEAESAKSAAENAAAQAQAALIASAKIYEQMDPAKAAAAISGLKSVQQMADILTRMASDKAAKIMEQMKSTLATKILSQMVK